MVEEVANLVIQLYLEVNANDVNELMDSLIQEITADELIEMHKQNDNEDTSDLITQEKNVTIASFTKGPN